MNTSTRARICWVEGSKSNFPSVGPQYSTVAKFADQGEEWIQDAWSLVLYFDAPPDESLCAIAEVRLLNPEGPSEYLHKGNAFELYEGRRLVARGEVL